jgi:hypothetical protein
MKWYQPHEMKWYQPRSGPGLPIIMAISDGHGSQKSFRSQSGAYFAVHIAVEIIKEFIESQSDVSNFTRVKRIAEEQLPKEFVRQWKAKVLSDIKAKPFSVEESERLKGKDDVIAYGATLLAVLVTSEFIMYWQIGDGDILTLLENGEIERPIPKDERLFANETTSLCAKDAWQDFRFCFQPILDSPPNLILLATDGYANSFGTDESFLKVASDILEIIHKKGFDFVRSNLQDWLKEASESGSGDDITVGIICSTER